MGFIIGIDASRNRSGGAKAHLIGILKDGNPMVLGVTKVHVWAYQSLADALPDYPWLVKHSPKELEKSLIIQMWWQFKTLPKLVRQTGCQILLNTDAGSVCQFEPSVVMSRDLLSYEKGEMARFGYSLSRFRLLALKYVQILSMKRAKAVIFLTHYASKIIQEYTGKIKNFKIINHGVGENFKQNFTKNNWEKDSKGEIVCLYISAVEMYKHQWHVVEAIYKLRKSGLNISIILAGGGEGLAQVKLDATINKYDPKRAFVKQFDFLPHEEIPNYLKMADLFIFASSCENMPNTLIEAMSSGLPIACSNRGPMPEVLEDAGAYFDPENPESIAQALEKLILEVDFRIAVADKAKLLSNNYSWSKCANQTWQYLIESIEKK
jgi:glycosyltransferase involved in cell wall biosynthesis